MMNRYCFLAGLIVTISCASAASAQPPSDYWLAWDLEVGAATEPLVPFTPTDLEVRVEMSCNSPGVKLDEDPVSISLSVSEGPEWLAATFDPNPLRIPLTPEECAIGRTVEATGTVRINVTDLAPPRDLEPVTFLGQIQDQPQSESFQFLRVAEFVEFQPQWVGGPEVTLRGDGYHKIRYVLDYRTNDRVVLKISADGGPHHPLVLFENGLTTTLEPGEGTLRGVYSFRPEKAALEAEQDQELEVVFAAITNKDGYRVSAPLTLGPGQASSLSAPHFLFLLTALLYLSRRRPSC